QTAFAADGYQPGLTLLNDPLCSSGMIAGIEPGMTTTQRRMARKRQLMGRCKDADTIIRARGRWRQDEGRFRQVRPACKLLHLFRGKPLGVYDHSDGVSAVAPATKDI